MARSVFRKVWKWTWIILSVLIIGFIIACFVYDRNHLARLSDEEIMADFKNLGVPGKIAYYTANNRKMRYVAVGSDKLPTLLFLHGSPGSMSYYTRRYNDTAINTRFRMFAVDRPGYGYSGLGDPEPSIQKQAEMIRPILDSLNHANHPIIVIGGSYGSSVACRLAMDHPELVDGLVLTGPSLGPGLEKYFWFTSIVELPFIRWFIPRIFRSANTEKVHHREELEKMLPLWKNIKVPVVYLQGQHDNLIDTANAGFARTHLVNATSLEINFISNREHRLAAFEWPRIRTAILDVYNKTKH